MLKRTTFGIANKSGIQRKNRAECDSPGPPWILSIRSYTYLRTYTVFRACWAWMGGPRPSWERDNLAYIEQRTLERTGPLEHRAVPRPLIAKRKREEKARSSNEENLGWKGLSSLISSGNECKDCWPFCGGYRETGLTRIASRRRLVFVPLSCDTRSSTHRDFHWDIDSGAFKKRSFYPSFSSSSSSSFSFIFIIAHWFHLDEFIKLFTPYNWNSFTYKRKR